MKTLKQTFTGAGFLAAVFMVILFCSSVTANIIRVPQQISTIQAALNSCSAGDTVLVSPGTYVENLIWPSTENICLVSEFGRDSTIIDGNNTSNVIKINSLSDTSTVIMGFTIRNGYSASEGGGIYCSYATLKIINNLIDSNVAQFFGGGISCYGYANSKIKGNIFRSNKTGQGPSAGGGAISCYTSDPLINNNTFSYNQGYVGGAVYCDFYSDAVVTNNEFMHNNAINGGGAVCVNRYSSPLIMNNLMEYNYDNTGGGAIGIYRNSTPEIRGNIIKNNSSNPANGWGGGIDVYHSSSPHIVKNIIEYNESRNGGGISFGQSSSGVVDSNNICNNIGSGIYCFDAAQPTINHNNITCNGNTSYSYYGILNADASIIIMAENNWWGSPTGPYHPNTNPAGGGDTVSDYVDYDPWQSDSVQAIGVKKLGKSIPTSYDLYQNYPNPFNPVTNIKFDLHKSANVVLKIYDILGRVVAELVNEKLNSGSYEVNWDASAYSSGVYFYRINAGEFTETKKMILIK